MKKITTVVFLLCSVLSAFATDYYLAENGSDANNGTSIATPWKTLQKLSAELGGSSGTWGTFTSGDRIFFRKGDTFRGSIAFSAFNNNGITFDSYGTGAMPIIKGSKLVTNWTVHSGNIWKATVSQRTHFLYVNGAKQVLARTPNVGTWNISGSTSTSINSNNIGTSGLNFVGANICLREFDWRLNRQVITVQNGNLVNWANAINAAGTNANFYFDNKLELLDTAGEWFYDVPTQTLYLMSTVNPNTLNIEAATELFGIAGNDNRSDNIIRNLQFEHFADAAITLKGASNNNQILNCKFNNNCNSFYVSGANATISDNLIENVSVQGIVLANMANSNIKFNTIINVGVEFGNHRPNFVGDFYSSGIWLIQANAGAVLANNKITNCGYNGIRFGGNGIIIEKNIIENTLLNMDDGGALYTFGSDSFNNILRNNIITRVVGDHNGTVPGGIVNGIYIDNYAYNITIADNTVEDIEVGSGILINAGSHDNSITGNTTYKCKEGLSFADWQAGPSIYNNTLSGNTLYANLQNSVPIQIASDDNNYNVLSNSNNNFLCNPYNNKIVNYAWSSSQSFTLAQWRTASGFDVNSVGSFYNWTLPVDKSILVKNLTANPVILNYIDTVDLNNNDVESLTLPPYSSKVLVEVGPNIWNGVAWSNGIPKASKNAIINGNYAQAIDLSANTLTVNGSSIVSVPSNFDFNITGKLTVAPTASLTFQNNSNLIQTNNVVNEGKINVKRNAAMRRQDYVFWGSPVGNQFLKAFSPETLDTRFYTYSEPFNGFVVIPTPATTTFDPAKGYMLRAPNTFPLYDITQSASVFSGSFTGIPNNGLYTIGATNSGANFGNNLLSNPYPSTLDANLFLAQNPGTLYFWTHTAQGANVGTNYASFNGSGGTKATAIVNNVNYLSETPNGTIQIGQGFIYRTSQARTVTFNNTMRTSNNAGQFFRNANTIERNRIWLTMTGSETSNQILVTYTTGATNGFDESFDGIQIATGTAISSTIGSQKFVIQGRSLPFVNTDVVPLDLKVEAAGNFSLKVNEVDGLFLGTQNIFLKDNLTGITHNIKTSPYNFTSAIGTFANRFELVYTNSILGIENPNFDEKAIFVFLKNENININSGKTNMKNIQIFDIRGRLVFEKKKVNANTFEIQNLKVEEAVVIVKITSEDNQIVSKKIVF